MLCEVAKYWAPHYTSTSTVSELRERQKMTPPRIFSGSHAAGNVGCYSLNLPHAIALPQLNHKKKISLMQL
jgi:hypothetical protein